MKELDLRTVPVNERSPDKIINAWKELAEGDTLKLINDHDPKPLRYMFQYETQERDERKEVRNKFDAIGYCCFVPADQDMHELLTKSIVGTANEKQKEKFKEMW